MQLLWSAASSATPLSPTPLHASGERAHPLARQRAGRLALLWRDQRCGSCDRGRRVHL